MTMKKLALMLIALAPSLAFGQIGRRIETMKYHHATVGTTAQDAISASSVDRNIKGWRICHDGGSANDYLAVSEGADPATDGIRLAKGECLYCDECSSKSLINANVKGSAASTGYSVLQLQ